jgi:serine/threonine protein kinase
MWTTQRESRPAGSDLSYRLVRRLNEDAIGALWIAEGADSGQVVTLRTLRDELVDHERFARWLRLELRPVSLLRHPNVLEVRSDDGDAHGRIAHVAMAAFEGESLARRLDGAGPLDRAAATDVAQRVRAALDAAHQIGLVHGCVSADSVLISADGDVRVIDFGIPTALWLAARHGQRSSNGSGGSHAPQLTGRAPDEAHDDRSVELLAQHMLSGHRPPEDELETLVQLVLADPRPSSFVSGAPPAPARTRRIAVGAAIVAAATVAVVGFAAIRSPS